MTVYASAEECLAQAVQAHCAIVDVALPGMSGLELAARLTASRHLPVIFVTAHVELATLPAIRRTGRPLLRKPLAEDDLLAAIARATRRGPPPRGE